MTTLDAGDVDLHDPADATLHRWWPEWPPDEARDREFIARAEAHARAHEAGFGRLLPDSFTA